MNNPIQDRIQLGNTKIEISPMGVGTWAWGDRMFWQYGKGGYDENDLEEAFHASLDAGINWFDTAEVYGLGRSEKFLGKFMQESGREALVATKFFPMPWRIFRGQLHRALRGSRKRLKMPYVHLYQTHWPYPPRSTETWVEELANAQKEGNTLAVGVSNYNLEQTRSAHRVLQERGLPLASNQVEYNLINREIERNGILDYCREHNITIIAYSPLAMGVLTGKYTPENPPPGVRSRRYNSERLRKLQPLITLMKEIGEGHGGKTAAQIALNWAICKGTVPIAGAKNARQARENASALGWRLSQEEIDALDQISRGASQ